MSESTFDGGQGRPQGTTRPRGAGTDLVFVLLAAVGTFLVAGTVELSESIGRWLHRFEPYQLDEILAAVTVLVLGLGWSSWRQSRQAATEVGLRLRAQESLNRQRAYLEVLFNENLSANLIAAGDGGITVANPELARLFGLDVPKAVVGRRLGDFYADEALWRGHREILSGGGRVEMNDLRIRRPDGTEAVVIARLTARRGPEGLEVHGFFTDVTALETTRRELAVALDENRRLAQRGIEMLEHERRNIARELHDEMGQWLNALKLDAVSIRGRDDVPAEVKDAAQSIVELTDHVYDVARSLMRRLRPVALDELGLGPAIQYCVDQWRRRHPAVKCEVRIEGVPESLGEAANITLYRMVQEGLTNVTKHARANAVTVAITGRGDAGNEAVRVDIVDDGVGVDEQSVRSGLGLPGLRERVEMLGGRFWVDSEPGRGTALHASLPGGFVGVDE